MAWFADLTPCTYFGEEYASFLRAIGWLQRGKPFQIGSVEPEVFDRLVEMAKDPWQAIMLMGPHSCDLCYYKSVASSLKNIFVPADGVVFVSPELIVHYMNAHGYRPPDEFCQAVKACPEMRSMQYLKALLANGAKPLVQA